MEKGSFSIVVFLTTPNDNTFLHSPFIIFPLGWFCARTAGRLLAECEGESVM